MPSEKPFEFAPHALRLSSRQWLVVAGVMAVLLWGVPAMWGWFEPLDATGQYRLPYDFSNDYWFCARWDRTAAATHSTLVLGDSVVWGEYVDMDNTLPAHLNRLAGGGGAEFANLGMNGLHPAAMLGMVRHHGGSVRHKHVLLVLNTLWMSSPRHDLREVPKEGEGEEASFNHPSLVPQFAPRVPAYGAPFDTRAGIVVERAVPFMGWVGHLKAKSDYYAALAAANPPAHPEPARPVSDEPRIDDPLPTPFRAFLQPVPAPENRAHSGPATWEARGIPVSNVAWPTADESFQWYCFREVVKLLRARDNSVLVLVTPFNPYLLTPESRRQHEAMVKDMESWLTASGVPFVHGTPVPTEEYADASHPLAPGHARVATQLLGDATFKAWVDKAHTPQ